MLAAALAEAVPLLHHLGHICFRFSGLQHSVTKDEDEATIPKVGVPCAPQVGGFSQ
jgi:hypothetical protein